VGGENPASVIVGGGNGKVNNQSMNKNTKSVSQLNNHTSGNYG
jgi:hypothetical protein